MNPRDWKKEDRIACVIAMVLSAVVGVVAGYIAYAAGTGADGATNITHWATTYAFNFNRYAIGPGAFWWASLGAIFGMLSFCVRQLLRGSSNLR